MISAYIDSIIMLLAGVYVAAVGFGWLPSPSKDLVSGQQWLSRYGKLFKIIGPLLIIIALSLIAARFFGVNG